MKEQIPSKKNSAQLLGGGRVVRASARKEGIREIVEADGKVARETLTVLDATGEAGQIEDEFKILGYTVNHDVQGRRAIARALDKPATAPDDARIITTWKLDRHRALIELVEAVAWHER